MGEVATVAMGIAVKVYGQESLESLALTLHELKTYTLSYSAAKKLVNAQAKIEIQTMKMSNTMLKAKANMTQSNITQLAKQSVLEEQHQHKFNSRMTVEKNAYSLRELYKEQGIKLTRKEAIVANQVNAEIIAGEDAKRIAMNETRKTLMAASISMFVLNISMGQLVTSLKPFVEGNEDAERALKDVSSALQFSMAPLQAYMSLQMISTSLAAAQKVAFLGVASSLGAIFFWYQATISQSPAMRAAYAAIATVLTAVGIASWLAATGIAAFKATLGSPAGLIAVAAAAVTMASVFAMSAPKAQTLTGRSKHVRKGGLALLDDDEDVVRHSKDGTKSSGGGDINIYLPDSYMGTLSDAKITALTVRRYSQTGQGSIQFKRKVASNG